MMKTEAKTTKLPIPPVLLLVFNRPQATERLYSIIRAVKPKQLFIAADGPRENPGDESKCAQVRAIVSQIDWECEVKRLYRETNIGLEKGLGEALKWFFGQVEMGIVLEDDCIPEPTFFDYCALMLDRFKNDQRIMVINGSSFLPSAMQDPHAYYVSKYVHFWGWASWKRAWQLYEPTMRDWPILKTSQQYTQLFSNSWERHYFTMLFDSTYRGKTNSWGYRWLYSVWKNGGRSISPGVNMVRNIGFTKEATHKVIRKFELPTQPMIMPPQEASNAFGHKADKKTARHYFAISPFMVMALKIFYALKK